jgi:hypothetical protein
VSSIDSSAPRAQLPEPPIPGLGFETREHTVSLDAEGIVHVRVVAGADVGLEAARDVIQKLGPTFGALRRPVFVDMTGVRTLNREARRYLAGPETSVFVSAVGLLVTSPLARAVGSFFLGINRPPTNPTRLFGCEAEALEWLRGFRA